MPQLFKHIAAWLLGGPRNTTRRPRIVRARYDAAQTTPDNRRHWAAADGLSARAANSPEVRRILRNRARYEVANNSYARGIVTTLGNDCVGTGPRLQVQHEFAREIEQQFMRWAKAVNLAEKLRTMRMAVAQDGEAFALLASNPMVAHAVKLDIQPIEADQVATPGLVFQNQPNTTDGIVFDSFGNPVAYLVLDAHPGDSGITAATTAKRVPAASMIHLFVPERPGQVRGIPELTAALPLFAQLRRYTLAVLAAAELAADFSGVLYTDAPPADSESTEAEPFEELEISRNMMLTLPSGYRLEQLRAEQPSTTYGEFKREILNEIARCLNMPANVARADSSGYNYASGRLDHQTYHKSIRISRHRLETVVLDRILHAWLDEAVLTVLPGAIGDVPHQWFWDGFEHVDPAKEANAQATRLASNTTTLAYEFARQGLDWEEALRQRARELALMRELGIDTNAGTPIPPTPDEDEYDTQTTEN